MSRKCDSSAEFRTALHCMMGIMALYIFPTRINYDNIYIYV